MEVFVIRLNSDREISGQTRDAQTEAEFNKLYESSMMDGFHETVNFLSESWVGDCGDPLFQKEKKCT